eukprot:CAMPEP_0113893558 /NCGR_PEP_ID=MMETSP0780_2-20120614/16166_1 /TAXON_ID=652834 /ORGANISM="Palpitomonas bilix" /LENGTH=447 /DNA_ID=CAMNT_0000883875 /DNA_START=19 /DNA_END=1362 /DNA_ORIENTATION=- /assembly_acc=CAM_ASM_000599
MRATEVKKGGKYAWYVVVLLLLTYIFNQWDRQLLQYIYDQGNTSFTSLHVALNLTDVEYGLLTGYAFSVTYVVLGIFVGVLADRFNRALLLFIGFIVWSAATGVTGLSTYFWHVLVARAVLGIGEAFCSPAAYGLIADYFPKERLATANSVYSFGVYVGGGLASLTTVINSAVGWRVTMYIIGGIGVGVSLWFVLTVKEPPRQKLAAKKEEGQSVLKNIGVVLTDPVLILLTIAASFRFIGGYSLGAFMPRFFQRVHPDQYKLYTEMNAFVVSAGGALSTFLGGVVSDKLGKKDVRVFGFVPAFGALLGIPFTVALLLIDNFYGSVVLLLLEYIVAECWFGPAMSVLQKGAPSNVRSTAVAIFLLVGTLVGSVGPVVLGAVDDTLADKTYVRYTLLAAVAGSYLLCAVFFIITAQVLKRRLESKKEDEKEAGEADPLLKSGGEENAA